MADAETFDMPLVQMMVAGVMDYVGEAAPGIWRRVLTIAVDGLRESREEPTPLPAPAIAEGEMAEAVGGEGRGKRKLPVQDGVGEGVGGRQKEVLLLHVQPGGEACADREGPIGRGAGVALVVDRLQRKAGISGHCSKACELSG